MGKIDRQWEAALWHGELSVGSVMTRGVGWRLQREGIYVYMQLIHVVQQKPTQHCNYPPI